MAQLFEPFGAQPGVTSSAGLGLPLCRELPQLMAGSLQVLPRGQTWKGGKLASTP